MLNKLRYIFSRKEKFKLVGVLVAIVVGSFFELLGVTVFMPFIELIMDESLLQTNDWMRMLCEVFHIKSFETFLAFLAGGICFIYLTKNIYLSWMQNMMLNFSYKVRMNLAVKLLSTYMREPYTFHLSKNVAELQRSLQVDANQFMLLVNSCLQLLAEGVVCLALGLYLFHTSHSITVIIVGLLVVCVGFFFYLAKNVSHRVGEQNQRYNAKLIQWVNQALGGIKEVKVLHRESFFVDAYKGNYKKLIKGAKLNEMLATLPKYIVETVCICGMLIAIVVKIFFGRREVNAFIPQLSAFAVASFRLLPSIGKINAYINSIMYSLPSLDLIYHDLKEIENAEKEDFETGKTTEVYQLKKGIRIENVSYKYPNTDNYVLENASFNIEKGKTIALIGSSGAGKTTMADIFLGLLPPCSGHIMADDWDVYECLNSWHRMLGYIPQSIYLSDDSIRNNIAFGIAADKIDDRAVRAALEKAQLLPFVDSLAEGLDTFVGDRGVRLSGGQRQRIGIARALYHEPEILVLDEATSALDNETEQAVMESIESLQGMKTMIIIAHRLTTIKKADIIYEVIDGRMVEKSKTDIFGEN